MGMCYLSLLFNMYYIQYMNIADQLTALRRTTSPPNPPRRPPTRRPAHLHGSSLAFIRSHGIPHRPLPYPLLQEPATNSPTRHHLLPRRPIRRRPRMGDYAGRQLRPGLADGTEDQSRGCVGGGMEGRLWGGLLDDGVQTVYGAVYEWEL